jgi:hypothetical protein
MARSRLRNSLKEKKHNAGAFVIVTLACAAIIGCEDSSGPHREPPPEPAIHLLALDTYEYSGQAVHPDPALTPIAWNFAGTQLVATPYPGGDASKENPSLYAGTSLTDWKVPQGVTNPIAKPLSGYLSDPDQIYNPETNELWVYYRHVGTTNDVMLIKGSSPTTWTAPELILSAPNHMIVSPSVVRRGAGDWLMWSVNSGTSGCTSQSTIVEFRTSTDGLHWSAPVSTDLVETDYSAWHIDVEWIPSRSEFWATYNVKVAGSCTTPELHFATSPDGLHWTKYPGPVLQRGAFEPFADIVYRSSLLYDPAADAVTIFYSGARFVDGAYDWRIATERIDREKFFERLLTLPAPKTALAAPPPLTNDDAP